MPTEPISITRSAEPPRKQTVEEQRVVREALVAKARRQADNSYARRRLQAARARLLTAARRYRDARDEQNHWEEAKAQLQAANPRLGQGGLTHSVAAVLMGAVKWLAILTIDLCLLAGVSHFLISLAYVSANGPPLAAMVVVPVALFLLEVSVAAHIAAAVRESRDEGRDARHSVLLWRLFGGVLAIVVPTLGTAALLTELTAAQVEVNGVSGLLVAGVIALAAVCHGSVIFGGTSAMETMARLVYTRRFWSFSRRIRRQERAAQVAQDAARDAILAYETELDSFRDDFDEAPRHLLIQTRDADLINDAIGDSTGPLPTSDEAKPEVPVEPSRA
jgi:hypothetical protein